MNFSQNIDEFHHKNGAVVVGYEQRALDNARNIDYGIRVPRHNANRNRSRDNQVWQENQKRVSNNYGGYQRNQGYYRPERDQRQNYSRDYLCDIHFVHGEEARKCGMPDSCPMTHLAKKSTKNGFPSFRH